MDDTGDTGDQIELGLDVASDELEYEHVESDDVMSDEIEHDEVDEVDEVDVRDETEVRDEGVVESRERHPAGAAALAKRVAMDRPTRIGVASLVFVALMFVFVFPTRSYLAQQRQVREARNSVQVLRAQNAKLAREAKRLQTNSEIERLARSQFNMVFPGEEAYSVVPPNGSATTTTTVP